MFKSVGALGPSPSPLFDFWGIEERRKRKEEEEEKGREREGEGISTVVSPLPAPRYIPLSPSPRETPSGQVQVGGQRRNSHRHLGAHQEESREGRKEGWREGAREGGRQAGGRRREGGEREGRRRDVRTKNRGAGAGKGCREGAARRPDEGVWRHLGAGQGARRLNSPARSRLSRLGGVRGGWTACLREGRLAPPS